MTIIRVISTARNLAAGGDPLGLTDVKAHLRVTTQSEDALIQEYMDASLGLVEGYVGMWFARWLVEISYSTTDVLPSEVVINDTAYPRLPELDYLNPSQVPGTSPIAQEDVAWDALTRTALVKLPNVQTADGAPFVVRYETDPFELAVAFASVMQSRRIIVGAMYLNRDVDDVMPPGALRLLDAFKRNQP